MENQEPRTVRIIYFPSFFVVNLVQIKEFQRGII